MRKLALLTLCSLLFAALTAHAQVNMGWGDSPSNSASTTQVFDCQSNTGSSTLVISIVPGSDIAGVTGFSIDLRSFVGDGGTCDDFSGGTASSCLPPPMPAFWDLGSGGCHAGAISASGDFRAEPWASSTQVLDPWQGNALVFGGPWTLQTISGYPQRPLETSTVGDYWVSGALSGGMSVDLLAGHEYYLARITVRHTLSTTAGGCAGCCTPVEFHPVTVWLDVTGSGSVGLSPNLLSGPGLWQGSAGWALCNVVPTRRSTWGALKSAYR